MTLILTLNCGSSSIKAKLYEMPRERLRASLHLEDVGLRRGRWAWECGTVSRKGRRPFPTYPEGLRFVFDQMLHAPGTPLENKGDLAAIAHRVVHGGPKYVDSIRITPAVIRGIQANRKLAPLHTPPNIKGIRVAQQHFPRIPHVAVFDTGFHKTIPDYAAAYPLPLWLFDRHHIRRYGFHGISYRYVMHEAAAMMRKPLSRLKLIACHLGSGCSVCAIDRGKSVDTSMGFTPVEGIMMRTRSGDLDPGLMIHLQRTLGFSTSRLNNLINHHAGLLGVSQCSTMPEVIKRMREGNRAAKLAFEMFCYRVEKYIGSYVATLGGIDGLIFTAGIGENQPEVRSQITKWCRGFGLKIDSAKNRRTPGTPRAIHAKASKAAILVIPTNEGLMMARDTVRLIR
jgi:acetate kinase